MKCKGATLSLIYGITMLVFGALLISVGIAMICSVAGTRIEVPEGKWTADILILAFFFGGWAWLGLLSVSILVFLLGGLPLFSGTLAIVHRNKPTYTSLTPPACVFLVISSLFVGPTWIFELIADSIKDGNALVAAAAIAYYALSVVCLILCIALLITKRRKKNVQNPENNI